MEEEIKAMAEEWDGEVPSAIPMLPERCRIISVLPKRREFKPCFINSELPLALDKETTNVVGFIPKKHGYFLIAEDTAQQSESFDTKIALLT